MKSGQDLLKLLNDVSSLKGPEFSGLGLVLYKSVHFLPHSPLKISNNNLHLPFKHYEAIVKLLAHLSNASNEFHDGFHMLNQNFELTHLSQYLAPPINSSSNVELSFGSRYRTAIYASCLEDIIACGVVSKNYEPTVFIKGNKF